MPEPILATPVEPSALAQAERAIELAVSSPRRARAAAERALQQARATRDHEAAVLAERALGLAALELKEGAAAVAHLRRAVKIALGASLDVRTAEARMSLGRALLHAGNSRGAFRELELADSTLSGIAAARLQFQRATLFHHHHRLEEALAGYRSALGAFRRAGDRLWEARALNNRGLIQAERGSLPAAEADLIAAAELYSTLELDMALADVEHNLGWVAARRGDVPAALDWYDRSQDRRRSHGVPIANGLSDRCELLLSVRLVAEARSSAERAVAELASGRMASETAEARLMLAEAALLDGDRETAEAQAATAFRSFARQARPHWASLARYTALRASLLDGTASPARLRAASRSAAALAEAGWTGPALDAQILSARLALALGRTRVARETLARIRVSGREPVELRVRAKHASALLALADGRRREAYAALRAGMRLLAEHRTTLGATELRAQVSGQGEEIARLGLRLAVEDADPRRVLAWFEECRASAIRLRPVRPPDDETVAAELAELRRVASLAQAEGLAGVDARHLRRRQAELEESIRRRTRRAPGGAEVLVHARTAVELGALLGDRALIAYFDLDGTLHAVTVVRRAGRSCTGSARQPRRGRSSMRSVSPCGGSHGGRTRPRSARRCKPLRCTRPTASTRHSCGRWRRPSTGGRSSSCRPAACTRRRGRSRPAWPAVPLTVAPSAASWAAAEERRLEHGGRLQRAAVTVGPGLPFARAEGAAVAALYSAGEPLSGLAATAPEVLAALEGADVAHLAAHGSFRADNPLFSSLTLADGPLTVYDLESLATPPSLCVLSACESGLSDVRAGDELMGLTAALLSLGTATIVASVVAVPDEPTRTLMTAFHEQLAAGLRPAEALALAQTGGGDGGERFAARAGFVCFGAG